MADLYDALSDADDAELFYVTDESPGITRRRRGKGFSYHHPDGAAVDADTKAWIETEIVIPPAWTDVWISPLRDGHILATGRDARGRKQYRYHPRWREVRDANKYGRMLEFGGDLPDLRKRVDADLSRRGMGAEKVLAAVVRLLDETLIRVGNEEYAASNESFGLTTITPEHVEVNGSEIAFEFTGKGGIELATSLRDRRLAQIVKRCEELPGHDLFKFVDGDGTPVDVTSTDVNLYLREITGQPFTAKDFRTWGGTVVAAETLADLGPASTEKEAEANIIAAVDAAAEALGNTRAVCRSCYVHPQVTEAYKDGFLHEAWRSARSSGALRRGERAVLKVLEEAAE